VNTGQAGTRGRPSPSEPKVGEPDNPKTPGKLQNIIRAYRVRRGDSDGRRGRPSPYPRLNPTWPSGPPLPPGQQPRSD
jgi:hypothetical protein